MSIKYSEIYTAGSVLTAGANDKMVIAVVNGLAPTGYTSKGILVSDFLLGAQQDWQSVMDNGSSALDIVSDAILTTDEFKIDFKSKKDEDREARIILDYFIKTEISYRDYISGTNLIKIDAAGIEIQDQLSLKGAFYSDDYEANFVARSLVTKQYVDGLNGIYSGSGILSGVTNVGINGNQLEFEGTFSKKTLIDIDGNLILEGSDIKFQVGRYSVDNTLPNGGVEITNGLGGGSRWGTIRGKGGTAFLTDQTTFLLYSDVDRASIFDFNHLNVLAGRFHSRVSGVIYSGGDLDISATLKIADGSQGNIGDVWTSTDALGNGGWAAGGGGGNGIYGGSDTIVAGVETLVGIPSVSKLNFGSGDLVITGANLPGAGQGRNVGIKVGAFDPLAPLQVGIGFNGSGQAPMMGALNGTTAIFQNNFNVGDTARLAIVSGINGNVSIDLGDTNDIDVARIFYRNSSNQMSFYTNAVEQVLISSAGEVTVNDLSGVGSRMVVSDAAGLLSTQTLPVSSGDGIYDGNGTIPTLTVATLTGRITFKSVNDTNNAINIKTENLSGTHSVTLTNSGDVLATRGGSFDGALRTGAAGGTAQFNVHRGASGQRILQIENTFQVGNGATGYFETLSGTGLRDITVRRNGPQHRVYNEFFLGDKRLAYQFTLSPNVNAFQMFDNATGLIEKVRISDEISWWNGDGVATYGFGFGTSAPISSTLHVKNMDFLVEGATDLNLLNIASATNQFAIGSVPFAGVKASIVNTEAQAYSFLVLNQSTTAEFGVMETGVVYTNSKIAIGVGTAPTSSSKLIVDGDIELGTARYLYFGDPTTDGTWRQYNDGLNFVSQKREVGVWVTKQTILA